MGCASDDSHSSCDKRPNASSCALSKHAVWALALLRNVGGSRRGAYHTREQRPQWRGLRGGAATMPRWCTRGIASPP